MCMKARGNRRPVRAGLGMVLSAMPALAEHSNVGGPYVGSGIEATVTAPRRHQHIFVEDTPFTMSEADLALTEAAVERLRTDAQIQGSISVSALDGVIMLQGGVRSVPMIYRAVELLRDLEAVREVNVDGLDRDSLTIYVGS